MKHNGVRRIWGAGWVDCSLVMSPTQNHSWYSSLIFAFLQRRQSKYILGRCRGGWGHGPLPRIFFYFGSQNGDLWCILGAIFCSSAKTLRGRKDTLARVYFYWGGAITPPPVSTPLLFLHFARRRWVKTTRRSRQAGRHGATSRLRTDGRRDPSVSRCSSSTSASTTCRRRCPVRDPLCLALRRRWPVERGCAGVVGRRRPPRWSTPSCCISPWDRPSPAPAGGAGTRENSDLQRHRSTSWEIRERITETLRGIQVVGVLWLLRSSWCPISSFVTKSSSTSLLS